MVIELDFGESAFACLLGRTKSHATPTNEANQLAAAMSSLAAQLQVLSRAGADGPSVAQQVRTGGSGMAAAAFLPARHDKVDTASILSEEGHDTSVDMQTVHAGALNALEKLASTCEPELWRFEDTMLFQATAGTPRRAPSPRSRDE